MALTQTSTNGIKDATIAMQLLGLRLQMMQLTLNTTQMEV